MKPLTGTEILSFSGIGLALVLACFSLWANDTGLLGHAGFFMLVGIIVLASGLTKSEEKENEGVSNEEK